MFEPYEICYQDLTPEAKDRLLSTLHLPEAEQNWEAAPLAVIDWHPEDYPV